MLNNSKIEEYIEKVCKQVRWVHSHNIIKTDLSNHITDQYEALIQDGKSEDEALEKAVLEMGDPSINGNLLDKAYQPKTNWWLLVPSILMIAFGMLAQFFANGEISQNYFLSLLMGFAVFTACSLLDYRKLIKPSVILLLTALLFAFALYHIKNTGHNFHIPNTYIYLFCPILFATSVCKLSKMQIKGFIISLALFCVMVILSTIYTTSLPTAVITAVSGLLILTAAVTYNIFDIKKRLALLILYLPTILITTLLCITKGSSIIRRLNLLLNPSSDAQNSGWLAIKIKELLSSAKFIGPSDSIIKWNEFRFDGLTSDLFLTKAIISIGWIALIVVALLLIAILFQGVKASLKQKNNFARLISLSIVITLFIQAASYISYNLGYLFFVEFPIPLFSGNLSLIINLSLIGVLFSIFRYSSVSKPDLQQNISRKKLFEFSNESLTINYK